MPAQVGGVFGHDDQVAGPDLDRRVAAGAHIPLARLIRLDRVDHVFAQCSAHPKKPQSTTATVSAMKPTTMAMSSVLRRCLRNGLKPIFEW